MSDLLCRWLNQELRLSKFVDPQSLARDFSTGYLIGEVLYKYQLQTDFRMFTKKDTSISKVNNFTRLEPTLQLLGITFDINTAQDLMQEKHGVATRLLYHLYTALEKKKRAEMTETMVEIMQPAAIANLHKREHDNYTDRLHQIVKRDAELKLMKIARHYEEKCQQLINKSITIHSFQLKSTVKVPEEKKKPFEKLRAAPQKTVDIGPIDQIAIIPKPPPYTKQLNLKKRRCQQQQLRREQLAKTVQNEIAQFELSRKKVHSSGIPSSLSSQPVVEYYVPSGSSRHLDMQGSKAQLILQSNLKYMQEIRNRLEESAMAREQREKRRDRFLLEQLRIHEAQEEARRDEHLVKRLTRQTQQEQRLASQLLQMRMQKAVIRQNRLFREEQYQQRTERDMKEALEREAALAEQAKLDRAKEIKKELEFFKKIAAERTRRKYEKHFKLCKDIVEQILDLATKTGEYRLITENLIPEKTRREWKELVLNGLPLYQQSKGLSPTYELYTPLDPMERRRLDILNNQNYDEYMEMVGDWAWPEEAGEVKPPPPKNNILGHIMHRLKNIIYPPLLEATSPSLPRFTIKACVLGNLCSGKTTSLAKIAEEFGVCVLSPDTLVEEALNAHIIGEQLSTRAALGAAAEKELIKGQGIPNDVIVDIIVEAIRHVPAQSGWILDGFPMDINQAFLLEKALGGSLEVGEGVGKRSGMAFDPVQLHTASSADPVLDMVVLLDVPDGAVIRRAFSHTDTDPAAETAMSPTEKNVYLAQIPQRITAFRDTWTRLGEWYGEKQNILVTIEANVDEDELYDRLAAVLKPVLTQKPDVTQCADEAPCATESVPHPKKKKGQRVNQHKPTRRASLGSLMPEYEPRGPHEYAVAPRAFVDEPLPLEIAEYLCSHWENVCESYVNNIRRVLQLLRSQGNVINYHLYNIREDFKLFLGRPDVKQEFVSQWQKDFNSIPDDMRDDEETKAELHLRLDELRERLWDISEKRKEQNEKERSSIIHEGWVDDNVAVLVNHHSSLIQAEINRLQESLCIFRVYYSSMAGEVIFEPFSHFIHVPLMGSTEVNVHFDYSIDTEEIEVKPRPTQGDEGKKVQFSLQCLPKFVVPKGHTQEHADPIKNSLDKLMFDYEEALKAIIRLVSAEIHQGEVKEPEKPPEKEPEKPPDKAKAKKGKQGAKEQKEPEPPPPPPTAALPEDKKIEFTCEPDVRKTIHKEYIAALEHEEKATKVKISLVKGHGVVMVQRLQARAEKVFQAMQKSLEENYHAEMKSIDQLTDVVRHHIESGAKLQNELILECSDFYMNGDCHMVPTPAPPTPPPPLEKPTPYTPTIKQLERLYQHLSDIAPLGLMSSSEFSDLLRDMTSVNIGRTMLPERWIHLSDKQLIEMVSLLMDQYELVDWRQFLLSAALPWPSPTLTQLLEVLQRFKAADVENTGYVNSEQYLQTKLWFSSKNVQPVSQEPSGAPPFDRLSSLRKFFFQLFANHSLSPPQMNYVSMLQYFAADPNPRQCFVRLLSVNLGQALLLPSAEDLVKSMPTIKDSSLSLIEADGETKGSPSASTTSAVDPGVSISALLTVLCHKVARLKGHRALPPGCPSEEEHTQNLVQVFTELGYEPEDCVPFSVLCQHLFIQDLMLTPAHYKLVNLHGVLQPREEESFIKEE